MRPILFHWHGRRIWSYQAMLYLGLAAGTTAGSYAARSSGLNGFRVGVATMVLLPLGLISGKLLHVATHWHLYQHNPNRIFKRHSGSAAQYGGLFLVVLISIPLLIGLQVPFGDFWDAAVFTILFTMIFSRLGCAMHGCCAGRPSDSWISVNLPNRSGVWARRIPSQFLEAAWGAILLMVAIKLHERLPFPGAMFLLITAGYACGRLVFESTRESATPKRFTINHGISVVLFTVSLASLAVGWPH